MCGATSLVGATQRFELGGVVSHVSPGGESLFTPGQRVTGGFEVVTDPRHPAPYRTLRSYRQLVRSFNLDFGGGKQFVSTLVTAEIDSRFTWYDFTEFLVLRDVHYFKIWAEDARADRFDFSKAEVIKSLDFDGKKGNDLLLDDVKAFFMDTRGKTFPTTPPLMQPLDPADFNFNKIILVWLDPAYASTTSAGARYVQVEVKLDRFVLEGSGGAAPPPSNRAPTLVSPGNRTVAEGSTLSFNLSASDPDGDRLTYSMSGAPSGATLSGNRFTYTPGTNVVTSGSSRVFAPTFTVSDGRGGTASRKISLTVTRKAASNSPPTLVSPGNRTVAEGASLSFDLSASDPDGDSLTYTMSGAPSGANLSGKRFTYSPGFDVVTSGATRSFAVAFTVSDGRGGSDAKSINLTVRATNRAPVLTNPGSAEVREGATLRVPLKATDPDGDALTFSLGTALPGLSLSGNELRYTPPAGTVTSGATRSLTIAVSVADGKGGTAQGNLVVTVSRAASGGGSGGAQPPADAAFNTRVETAQFIIETSNVNAGRGEGLEQGFDGNVDTKCLHRAPTALYRITPKVSGTLAELDFFTGNDAPSRDPVSVVLPGYGAIELSPPAARKAGYGIELAGGMPVTAGESFLLTLKSNDSRFLQYSEMVLTMGAAKPSPGPKPAPGLYTALLETDLFTIETYGDNTGLNKRREGLAQGFDGSVSTKCLHWAPTARYRFTPKVSGRLVAFEFVTANDAPSRDIASVSLPGRSAPLGVVPPSGRFTPYKISVPGGFQVTAGQPFEVDFAAVGTMLLQYAEMNLVIEAGTSVGFTARAETADFVVETLNDNDRVNGRAEALAQGLDGKVRTKCLHWASEALYQITAKRNGRLTGLTFTTANDAPGRDPMYLSIEGIEEEIVVLPPTARFASYTFVLPRGGLSLRAGQKVFFNIAARGTEYLQYSKLAFQGTF
jgi:hypothetical protein